MDIGGVLVEVIVEVAVLVVVVEGEGIRVPGEVLDWVVVLVEVLEAVAVALLATCRPRPSTGCSLGNGEARTTDDVEGGACGFAPPRITAGARKILNRSRTIIEGAQGLSRSKGRE